MMSSSRARAGRGRGGWVALALALALAESGCVAMVSGMGDLFAPVSGWTKDGVTEEDQQRDEKACDAAAVKTHGPGGGARLAYEHCMRAKGYELTAK